MNDQAMDGQDPKQEPQVYQPIDKAEIARSASLKSEGPAISSQLQARLDALQPGETIEAMIKIKASPALKLDANNPPILGRPNAEQRARIAEAVKKAATQELPVIDPVVDGHGLKRKSEPNALAIVVADVNKEATEALAKLGAVKSIMENQNVKPLDEQAPHSSPKLTLILSFTAPYAASHRMDIFQSIYLCKPQSNISFSHGIRRRFATKWARRRA